MAPLAVVAVLAIGVGSAFGASCDEHRIEPAPAPGAAVPDFSSFLLRVERAGAPASHLFGTLHSADPRVLAAWSWLRVLLSSERPRLLVTERDLVSEAPQGSDGTATPPDTLIGNLARTDPELYRLTAAALGDLGMAAAISDGLSMIQALALLEQSPAAGRRRGPVLDEALQRVAQELGIPLLPLESRSAVDERVASAMAPARQRELLWAVLCNKDLSARSVEEQTTAFAGNDVAALYRVLGTVPAQPGSAQAALMETLVTRRNASFWERLEPEFVAGGLFVAVGNLHLFSASGLVERLAGAAPYRVVSVGADDFQFTLANDALAGLIDWSRRWLREQEGIAVAAPAFAALSVEFRAEAALQAAFCPGRRCRVEGSYDREQQRVLLTESMFARLAAAGYPVSMTLRGAPAPTRSGTAAGIPADVSYPESIVVRELVRHGFAVHGAGADPALTNACRRRYVLHRASIAQARYLRERLSRERPHVFPLSPECATVDGD